jgi:hypothetical protein
LDLPLTPRTQALILRYEHDRPVIENTARDALKLGGFESDREVAAVVLHPYDKDTFVRHQKEQDWSWAFDENERFAEALLARERELGIDLPIHLFGCAPLVLMLHLAWCLSRRPLYIYQQSKDGIWTLMHDRAQPAAEEDFFLVEGLPDIQRGGLGKVALVVEVTHSIRDIALANFQARYPAQLLTTVCLRPARGCSEHAVQHPGEVSRAAEQFRRVLDTLHERVSGAEAVLLAMDCPGSFAAALGTALNANTQHPLRLLHYDSRSREYLDVHTLRHRQRLVSARTVAFTPRLVDELKQVSAVHKSLVEWLRKPKQKRLVERLEGGSVLLDSLIDATPSTETTPLFRYLSGNWKFHVELVAGFQALRERLQSREDWEEFIRLFLIHEAYHVAQGGVTSYDYRGVGRTGFVLETVDYDADVAAIEVARAWRREHRPDTTRPEARAFEEIIWIMLESLRIFEAPERPLRDLPERRLRRYLIWLFHACRFGTQPLKKEAQPELERVIVEVSGLPTFPDPYESYRQSRVRLEGAGSGTDLVLALYFRGKLVRKEDPAWIRDLLLVLSRWDERPREEIKQAMGLLFERLFNQYPALLSPGRSTST